MAQTFHATSGFQHSAGLRFGHDLKQQTRRMSDGVIGDVLQRAPMRSFRVIDERRPEDSAPQRPPLPSLSVATQSVVASTASVGANGNPDLLKALVPLTQIIAASGASGSNGAASIQPRAARKSSRPDDARMSPSSKPRRKRIRVKTERRRQQCRQNQARYRDKQRNFQVDLETSVKELRDEIRELQLQRYSRCYGEHTKLNAWNVVVEYFNLFRFGFLVPFHDGLAAEATNTTDMLDSPDTQRQQAFLRAAMAPDVACGELRGIAALTEQWRRYSVYFGNLQLQLESMEKGTRGEMLVTATLGVTVTPVTLRYVFPHLLEGWQGPKSAQDDQYASVAAKLLNHRLECRCSLRFEWDDAISRVGRIDSKLDLMSPLTRLLGCLEDVALVLEHARISPENALGDLEGHPTFVPTAAESNELP